MTDRILIVDDVATNRIVLKVRLEAASYAVLQASTVEAALASVAANAPGLVLVSDRIGDDHGAEDLCRRLAADPQTKDMPVIVIGHEAGHADRLGLLAAGAADHLVRPLDDATLLARVRSLLRQRPMDLAPRLDGFAFAEAPSPRPEPPGLIAIVAPGRETALRWKSALAHRIRDRIICLTPDHLLESLAGIASPDVFVISAEGARMSDLRLIAELKARQETGAAPILIIGGGAEPEFGIMALDLGAGDVLPNGFDADELVLRLRARLRQKRDGERRQRNVSEGLRLALTDPLTGLLNRRAILARMQAIASDSAANDRPYALMILDVDRFKSINDGFGHSAGDAVLTELARRMMANVREGDLVGRIGGEEFLVLLPDTSLGTARKAAERLRRVADADPIRLPSGEQVHVTLSIGLCMGTGRESGADTLLDRADRALYAAKADGRNKITVSHPAA